MTVSDITVVAADVNRINTAHDRVIPVVLAATVTAGQVLYQTTTGTFGLADADGSGTTQPRGIALQGGATGEVVDMLVEGEITGYTLSGLDYDAAVYLSAATPGALADGAAGSNALIARVFGLTDKDKTRALYVFCDWCSAYS